MKILIEIIQTLHDFLELLFLIHQNSDSEMMCSFFLTKATPRHKNYPRLLHGLKTIKLIRLLFSIPCSLYGLIRECNTWKCIHGTLHINDTNILHLSKRLGHHSGSSFQAIQMPLYLHIILLDSCLGAARLNGRTAHQSDHNLSYCA